jgi:hypothetical protein
MEENRHEKEASLLRHTSEIASASSIPEVPDEQMKLQSILHQPRTQHVWTL